jgi:hypothetical protein
MKYILELLRTFFCENVLIRLIVSYDIIHQYMWYNGHCLLYGLTLLSNVCMEALDLMVL